MAGSNVRQFDDDNFEAEVLKSDIPVLVDFWAEWCAPCQILTPVIEELANDYQGKLKVGKLNVDRAQRTAAQYGIQSIPTVILFDNGQPVEAFVGVRRKGDYQALIESKLNVG